MSSASSLFPGEIRDCTDDEALRHLILYCESLLHRWLRCQQVQHADAEDLVQESLATVVRESPTFHTRVPSGVFHAWLRKVLRNRLRNFRRAQRVRSICRPSSDLLGQLTDEQSAGRDDLARRRDKEHDRHVFQQMKQRIEPAVQPKTWQAFWRLTFEDADPVSVAAELDLSLASVYAAKSRVLKRLRREAKTFPN
jgi:RNA polymerase sigma-70 factor (ECF subfamily)